MISVIILTCLCSSMILSRAVLTCSIQYTFNRRERALLEIASMKASATSLFVLSREWPRYSEYRSYSLKYDANEVGGDHRSLSEAVSFEPLDKMDSFSILDSNFFLFVRVY